MALTYFLFLKILQVFHDLTNLSFYAGDKRNFVLMWFKNFR